MTKKEAKQRITKRAALLIMTFSLLLAVISVAITSAAADSYYTIRINYVNKDGVPVHDPYIATYPSGEAVTLEVTNPVIDGFDPVTAPEGGFDATKTSFNIASLDSNVVETVYYVAGLTHYSARYYLQNIYDDLYTLDRDRTEQNQDLRGPTGSSPNTLEKVIIPGFTNLFREPDAIAADGSTVFRVYYDRNYYSVSFDLGDGGYGVDPIYAKFETEFRIDTPKRIGYTFLGWVRTSNDSSKYSYLAGGDSDKNWHFVDPDDPDVELTQEQAMNNLVQITTSYVPCQDAYYQAVWEPATTGFAVTYWLEDANSSDYSVIATKDVHQIYRDGQLINVTPGMTVNTSTDKIPNAAQQAVNWNAGHPNNTFTVESGTNQYVTVNDFFAFNLGYANSSDNDSRNADPDPDDPSYDPDKPVLKYEFNTASDAVSPYTTDNLIDFIEMSKGESVELKGCGKFFQLNTAENTTDPAYVTETTKIIRGDGTTHINVFYKRRPFTLKFYYARQKIENDQLVDNIQLTSGTKKFSKYNYYKNNQDVLEAVSMKYTSESGVWSDDIAATLPQIKDKYLKTNGGILEEKHRDYPETGSERYRYYYYEVTAKYNENLSDKWLIDAITAVGRKDKQGQECIPGSWAVEYGTNFYFGRSNLTVKGVYEKLGQELMFRDRTQDYTELHYLLSWTNTGGYDWNNGLENVLNFTYENYIELLPMEVDMISGTDVSALINADLYENVIQHSYTTKNGQTITRWYGLKCEYKELSAYELQHKDDDANANGISDLIDSGEYRKLKYDEVENKWYGLKTTGRIETVDSGNQYPRTNNTSKTNAVYNNQVPTDLAGFELENYEKIKGKITLNETNTDVTWVGDAKNDRHGQIKFFYHRRQYTLYYRNGNRMDENSVKTVYYQAPINSMTTSGEYRYYYANPPYYIDSLSEYYNFVGWYEDPEHTPALKIEVDNPDNIYRMPADDDTLYAYWEPKKIDVIFYNDYNDFYLDRNRIVLGQDSQGHNYSDKLVEYGSYIDLNNIPINDQNQIIRPKLTPPAEKATFAGWYYIRNRIPVRFEPEKAPITGLNEESSVDNGRLRLYAEWVTTDAAKFQVRYIRQDTGEEIATPTIGRAFIYKTKTFNAKSGNELYDDYKWTAEKEANGENWWPTVSSHSFVVRMNDEGEEYEPNTFDFPYIQKARVHYKVQYLDASTGQPVDEVNYPAITADTPNASIKIDAPIIPGWIAEHTSQTLVLTASTAATPEEQAEQELAVNILTFYYNKNEKEYLYEVEYYTQDLDANTYTLSQSEILTVPIAAQGDTTVSVSSLFSRQIPSWIEDTGFTREANQTKYTVTNTSGVTTEPVIIADDGTLTIDPSTRKTIKIYFSRNIVSYSYQLIDYRAERIYLDTPAAERDGLWNGVMEDHSNFGTAQVGKEITIPAVNAPTNYVYTGTDPSTPYTRVDAKPVTLTIEPYTDLNCVKVYYRKDAERRLDYKVVCVNSNSETDYDSYGIPLFGSLSRSAQTVLEFDEISNITFYNYNNATVDVGGQDDEGHVHMHRYTFLGWYKSKADGSGPDYDPDNPSANRMTQNTILTKNDLGINDLPATDTVYYALVMQDMIKVDFDFLYTDEDLKTANDASATAIVERATPDDGTVTGSYFHITYPNTHRNHDFIPWHRTAGINLQIDPVDGRVYKYEFAEWWQKDATTGNAWVRKAGWNSPDTRWSSDALSNVIFRQEDQHYYAVFTRKEIDTLDYAIDYTFTTRTQGVKTLTKTGTLDLTSAAQRYRYNYDDNGAFVLTDEFIIEQSPYESNYGQVLKWSDKNIQKSSVKGSGTTADKAIATVTAVQVVKPVVAHYRTVPGDSFEDISTFYGANYELDEQMLSIEAPESYNGCAFSYWAVRKTNNDSAPIVAKSYSTLFDLCMMDNYFITPVYEGAAPGSGSKSATLNPDVCANNDEDWIVWTWNVGEPGMWVRPDSNMIFHGLNDKMIVARVPQGTAIDTAVWDSTFESIIWNKTAELDVQDGYILTLTGYSTTFGDKTMYGSWSDSPADPVDPASADAEASVTLTHLDYSRNRWTDAGIAESTGLSDLLFSDFEIAFSDGENTIRGNNNYQAGVVFELCGKLGSSAVFNPARDYGFYSDPAALKAAILSGSATYVTQNKADAPATKTRNIQFSQINIRNLTNKDRVEFTQYYPNAYKETNGTRSYTNSVYLMKATAYLIKDKDSDNPTVTLSNSVYICLKTEAAKDDALEGMWIITPATGE